MEAGEHGLIHLYRHILGLQKLFIASVDLFTDPRFKRSSNQSVNDIDNVLPWELHDFILWWQCSSDDWVHLGEVEEVSDR